MSQNLSQTLAADVSAARERLLMSQLATVLKAVMPFAQNEIEGLRDQAGADFHDPSHESAEEGELVVINAKAALKDYDGFGKPEGHMSENLPEAGQAGTSAARDRLLVSRMAGAIAGLIPLAAHELEGLKNDNRLDDGESAAADLVMSSAEAALKAYEELGKVLSSGFEVWKYDTTPDGAVILHEVGDDLGDVGTVFHLTVPGSDKAPAVALAVKIVSEHNALGGVFAEKVGMDAAALLLHAYARGEAQGGSVNWGDVNRAFEMAKAENPDRYEQILDLYTDDNEDDGGD